MLESHYDPYRLPQKGAQETWPFFTLNTNALGRLVVFRDSFACAWYQFLGQHFREVLYIWHHEWNRPLLKREQPDVVIDEILERFLNVYDPLDLQHRDELSETNSGQTTRLAKP